MLLKDLADLCAQELVTLGLFGGTFDPPHLGHQQAMLLACEELKLSRLLVMPAGFNPLKFGHNLFSNEQRLEMLNLLTKKDPRLLVSDWEVQQFKKTAKRSYSIDTIIALRAVVGPDLPIYFIVGSDVFADFEKFQRYQELLQLCKLVVITRPGVELVKTSVTPDRILTSPNLLEISSTELRKKLVSKHFEQTKYLAPEIITYLEQHAIGKD
jgi:nicotinate-nucleotide adenylyltransferase